MKNPNVERFDPKANRLAKPEHRIRPESVNFSGVPEITPPPKKSPGDEYKVATAKRPEKSSTKRTKKTQERIPKDSKALTNQSPVPPDGRPGGRAYGRTGVRREKRVRVRYAFDFYQDQIARLQERKRMAAAQSDEFSMSRFVRDAVDKALGGS